MKRLIFILFLCLMMCYAIQLAAYHPRLQTDYSRTFSFAQTARADSATGFDVTKYEIYLAVNDQSRFISGRVKVYVTAEELLTYMQYNLVGLTVSQVKVNDVVSTFTHQNGIVSINLNMTAGQQFTTEVIYSGIPLLSPPPYNLGIIFGTNTVFTLSDPDASRYWWPCYDHPWDKAIVDLHITMRSDWLVACNGIRESIVDNGNGTKTHNWIGSNPMATYLACFTAGPFLEINQTAGTVPIQNFVTQSQYNNALTDFSTLPTILQHFETLFGEYPFEKYGNAVVTMTTYGAMEHQTMTTLGMQFITGNHSGEVIIAHELAHQWFGNCVTPLTFKDVWLSEGFATYSEFLWTHKKFGWQSACSYMSSSIQNYYISFENANGHLPNIIYDPAFNYYFYPQSYEKAASVLHMLRLKIGNYAFFQLLQDWVSTYHNGNVITAEFQAMAEQISGQDLHQFFQQWIYSRGLPSLEYTLLKNPQSQQGKVFAKSTSSTDTQFWMEFPFVSNSLAGGDSLMLSASPLGTTNTYALANGIHSFSINAIDPNNWVLCRQKTVKDVNLALCLPADNLVYLDWHAFNQLSGFAGYHVYRRVEADTAFTRITATPVTNTDYIDQSVQNGSVYYYRVSAVDNEGFETTGSNVISAIPVIFPFDQGLLVVDETRDGTGSILSPTDAMVDDFYAAALTPFSYANWDCATQGMPSLDILKHYPIIFWHSDDFSQIQIGNTLNTISSYLLGGGILIISGWKTPGALSDDFNNLWLPMIDYVYDNGAVLISAQSNAYSTLYPDADKLPANWNGMLSMLYTFSGSYNVLYTAQTSAGAAGSGLPAAIRFDNTGILIIFGFPLYYMQPTGARGLLQELISSLYEPVSIENNSVPQIQQTMFCSPNPFRSELAISFSRKTDEGLSIAIFNSKGQKVNEIAIPQSLKEGVTFNWNAFDKAGNKLPTGIYFLKLTGSETLTTKKVLLLR